MRKLFGVTIILTLFYSCYYNNNELPQPTLTYTQHTKKIIDNKCNNCHSPTATQLVHLPYLTNYNEVKNQISRIHTRALIQETMPPSNSNNGVLTQRERDTLQLWLNKGAKE
ncbi:MAG: hypothetical protein VR77_07445 [Flavobacteriales bacterium BRH_c54]|nr:MAG: hypothetical protein VR77_07445 [Flavobacteriales bacterium BRH_c54]